MHNWNSKNLKEKLFGPRTKEKQNYEINNFIQYILESSLDKSIQFNLKFLLPLRVKVPGDKDFFFFNEEMSPDFKQFITWWMWVEQAGRQELAQSEGSIVMIVVYFVYFQLRQQSMWIIFDSRCCQFWVTEDRGSKKGKVQLYWIPIQKEEQIYILRLDNKFVISVFVLSKEKNAEIRISLSKARLGKIQRKYEKDPMTRDQYKEILLEIFVKFAIIKFCCTTKSDHYYRYKFEKHP